MNGSGQAVVVWSSEDGNDFGVFAKRRYFIGGVTGAIPVNQQTINRQIDAQVAMSVTGGFVVVWVDWLTFDIKARVFDSGGLPLTDEFTVNTTTTGVQGSPAVAMEDNGEFVVVWESVAQDGDQAGVFGQRFAANGSTIGAEFQVNTYTTHNQDNPDVAMDADGNFVVVWQSQNQDGDNTGVFGQRYLNTGIPVGGEFPINTIIAGAQNTPAVAMDANGGFVVSWGSPDGDFSGIYARVFSPTGVANAPEFLANTTTVDYQELPDIAMNPNGNFAITWRSLDQDGDLQGVFARYFNLLGQPVTDEFQVNTFTTNNQNYPRLTMADDGAILVVWASLDQDGSQDGIYGQLTNGLPTPYASVTPSQSCSGPFTGAIDLTISGGLLPYSILWSNGLRTEDLTNLAPGTYTVSISDEMTCQVIYTVTVGCVNRSIPTLGQWGVLCLSLTISIVGLVALKYQQVLHR